MKRAESDRGKLDILIVQHSAGTIADCAFARTRSKLAGRLMAIEEDIRKKSKCQA